MAIPRGLWDETGVADGWFDETQQARGWFDQDLLDTTSSPVAYTLSGDAGSYTYTGQDATLTYTPGAVAYTLAGDAGIYTYTGQDAEFAYSGTTGGGVSSRDIRKRVWIDGEPYDIPVDALGEIERWMPKKAIKKAAKEKRIPKIEVIGRTNDGVEVRQEVKQEEWPVMATFLTQATFITPGILDFAEFEEARRVLRRRKIITLLLMAA